MMYKIRRHTTTGLQLQKSLYPLRLCLMLHKLLNRPQEMCHEVNEGTFFVNRWRQLSTQNAKNSVKNKIISHKKMHIM